MTSNARPRAARHGAVAVASVLLLAAGAAHAEQRSGGLDLNLPPDALPPLSGGSTPGTSNPGAAAPDAGGSAPAAPSNRRLKPSVRKPPMAQPEDRNGFFSTENQRNVYGLELRRRF
jgi:hypothetical protein